MNKYNFSWSFKYKETLYKAGRELTRYMKTLTIPQDFKISPHYGGRWGYPYCIRVKYHAPQDYKKELQSICKELQKQEKEKTVTIGIAEPYDD